MPATAGHSFSFTKDGFWEEALFEWDNDRKYTLPTFSMDRQDGSLTIETVQCLGWRWWLQ